MSWGELNDWLALYEVQPWGEERKDIRAAVQSRWMRGDQFGELPISFPHISQPTDIDDISDEDELEIIAQLESMKQADADAATRTAESEADRLG